MAKQRFIGIGRTNLELGDKEPEAVFPGWKGDLDPDHEEVQRALRIGAIRPEKLPEPTKAVEAEEAKPEEAKPVKAARGPQVNASGGE